MGVGMVAVDDDRSEQGMWRVLDAANRQRVVAAHPVLAVPELVRRERTVR
ncbi:hypothetical protein G9444_0764 [Rhodococcus erythropolis]|uniref:Uncharacterized protein n=1 Tax=Rhodococcus erythropolis TaxID=1833 RepID=A0A6G9CLW9_RHOER|nr:hypothetical protein G9444_0764 [Rhodococcus erythropolis]